MAPHYGSSFFYTLSLWGDHMKLKAAGKTFDVMYIDRAAKVKKTKGEAKTMPATKFHEKNILVALTVESEFRARLRDMLYHYQDGALKGGPEMQAKMQDLQEFLVENDMDYFW